MSRTCALMLRPAIAILAGLALAACGRNDERPAQRDLGKDVTHDTVVRLDAALTAVTAVVAVGPDPLLLTSASHQIWTLNLGDGTLSRVDPATGSATTVHVGEAVGIASDGRDLWVAHDANVLSRVNGATGRRELSFSLARRPLFALRDAGFPAVANGSVWLIIPHLGRADLPQALWRIDAATGQVVKKMTVGPNAFPPVTDGRYLWVVTREGFAGKLTRVDTRSGALMDVPTGDQPVAVAAGAGSIWVGHALDRQVWRLNRETINVRAKISVEGPVRGLAFGGGVVWVTTESDLVAIDPVSNQVKGRRRITEPLPDLGPIGVAYVEGSVWVSVE